MNNILFPFAFTNEFYPGFTSPEDQQVLRGYNAWQLVTGIRSLSGNQLFIEYDYSKSINPFGYTMRAPVYLRTANGAQAFRIAKDDKGLFVVWANQSRAIDMARGWIPLLKSKNPSYILKQLSNAKDGGSRDKLRKFDVRHMGGSLRSYVAALENSWVSQVRCVLDNFHAHSGISGSISNSVQIPGHLHAEVLRIVRDHNYSSPQLTEIHDALNKLTNAENALEVRRKQVADQYTNADKWVVLMMHNGGVVVGAAKVNVGHEYPIACVDEITVAPRLYKSLRDTPEQFRESLMGALVMEKSMAASDPKLSQVFSSTIYRAHEHKQADPDCLIPLMDYIPHGRTDNGVMADPSILSYCLTSTAMSAGHFYIINRF